MFVNPEVLRISLKLQELAEKGFSLKGFAENVLPCALEMQELKNSGWSGEFVIHFQRAVGPRKWNRKDVGDLSDLRRKYALKEGD